MKKKTKITLSVSLSTIATITMVTPLIILSKTGKEKSINLYGFNSKINSSRREKYINKPKISVEAKNNKQINQWIKNIQSSKEHSFAKDKDDLFNLKISNELKLFMLQNLKEKYQIYEMQQQNKIKRKQNSSIQTYSAPQPVVWNLNGEMIPKRGEDKMKIHDYVFKTDTTYIDWSNYTIMNDEQKIHKKDFEKLQEEEKGIKKYISTSAKNWLKCSVDIFGESVNFGIKKILGKAKKLKHLLGFSMGNKLPVIMDAGEVLSVEEDRRSKISGLMTSALRMVAEKGIDELVDIPVLAPLGYALKTIDVLLNVVKLGNDASIWDNYNDHGLNDWKYQMNHNLANMTKIAYSYSEEYAYGVQWKVTDGWFSYPELYIKTRNDDESWKFLSPGTSFNFGHKISLYEKPQELWQSISHFGGY